MHLSKDMDLIHPAHILQHMNLHQGPQGIQDSIGRRDKAGLVEEEIEKNEVEMAVGRSRAPS